MSHVKFMLETLGYNTICWWLCCRKIRKSPGSHFSLPANLVGKIVNQLLSVFLRLCVDFCHGFFCVVVNYWHCHQIYEGVMVWSVNAVVPPSASSPAPSFSGSSISHIGRCHFMPDDYSQPPVSLCPIRGTVCWLRRYPCIHCTLKG